MDRENRPRALLQYLGIAEALKDLSLHMPCRYAAIFEVQDGDLVNRYFHDKRGEPRPAFIARVPFKDSFCHLALRDGELRCANSATDSRMDYSPYKGLMLAYHAVPILDPQRSLKATLCVFDEEEVDLSDEQFARLALLASLLPPFLEAERQPGAWRARQP
ncbi:hypothetical protein [Pseudorhodoferax sp. Leaf267]|uniref:hypothetical protein n=1 Tax=Pseudorhodoferax sp. Leaf267 TaxID=1736316 RepID=UPI0012E29D79|nr:hypothetical protein [Pseudorhodoferax sp. Leaf267]